MRRCRTEPGASATPRPTATRATRLELSPTSWRMCGVNPAWRQALMMAWWTEEGGELG